MSSTRVTTQLTKTSLPPRKKSSLGLFYHILSDMKHQRVAVITLAVGQTVLNVFSFYLKKMYHN